MDKKEIYLASKEMFVTTSISLSKQIVSRPVELQVASKAQRGSQPFGGGVRGLRVMLNMWLSLTCIFYCFFLSVTSDFSGRSRARLDFCLYLMVCEGTASTLIV